MATLGDNLSVYRELADHYDRLGQVSMRDRFLMLAADAALAAGQPDEAERLRQRLLATSRHHMLRPYASFAEAARAADVQTYLANLKANYPLSQARDLLETLRSEQGSAPAPAPPPMPAPAPRPIPPTAPVIDVNARGGRFDEQRPIYPLQPDEQRQPARPRAQPAPPPAPAPRPSNSVPVAAPVRRAAPAAAPTPDRRHEAARPEGGGFGVFLAFVVGLVALAVVAFALARPFLSAWLP